MAIKHNLWTCHWALERSEETVSPHVPTLQSVAGLQPPADTLFYFNVCHKSHSSQGSFSLCAETMQVVQSDMQLIR